MAMKENPVQETGKPDIDWTSIEEEEPVEVTERVLLPGETVKTGEQRAREIIEQAHERYRKMSPAKKKAAAAKMLVGGETKEHIEGVLGVSKGQVTVWFDESLEEMRGLMKEAQQKRALLEIGANMETLVDLRRSVWNEETRRKAVADLQRVAGAPIDAVGTGGAAGVVVHAQNAQINQMSLGELDKRLEKLAAILGEEGKSVVASELAEEAGVGRTNRRARGDAGAAAGATPA